MSMVFSGISASAISGSSSSISGAGLQGRATLHSSGKQHGDAVHYSQMNPKTLQYIMGRADISVTLNRYTHVNLEDAREEIARPRIV